MANYISEHKKKFNFKTFVQNALQEDVGDGDHSAQRFPGGGGTEGGNSPRRQLPGQHAD